MLEYIILGFLMGCAASGYDLSSIWRKARPISSMQAMGAFIPR